MQLHWAWPAVMCMRVRGQATDQVLLPSRDERKERRLQKPMSEAMRSKGHEFWVRPRFHCAYMPKQVVLQLLATAVLQVFPGSVRADAGQQLAPRFAFKAAVREV